MAFALVVFLARRNGARWQEPLATLGLSAVAAIAGARVWSLLQWWWTDREMTWIWDPLAPAGYSSAGAFLGGGLALLAARAIFGRQPFASLLDIVLPAGFTALALARLGCVFERCDPGRATDWFGVTYPDGAHLHPFGAYLAGGTLLAVVVALRWTGPAGRQALVVTLGYAAVRLLAEFTRDAPTWVHGGHLVAALVAIVGVAWWLIDGRPRPPV